MQRERVHGAGELVGEQPVDSAMALDQALTFKARADQGDAEMRFCTSGDVVLVALVADIEVLDLECAAKPLFDGVTSRQGVSPGWQAGPQTGLHRRTVARR